MCIRDSHATAAELESGTFTFVEVKSCMDDFTSGHGRTFEGDENWLVCPLELADSLASKGMLLSLIHISASATGRTGPSRRAGPSTASDSSSRRTS